MLKIIFLFATFILITGANKRLLVDNLNNLMSKLELSHILGSSTSRSQQIGYAQDFLIYISGATIIFYSPVVDQQIAYLKHSSPYINCIAVSPCEQFLAVCSTAYSDKQKTLDLNNKKNNIIIYKLGEIGVSEPVVSVQLKGHKYIIDHLAFSPDSRYLVSICNKDGSMFVWDCTSGERITQNKNSRIINSVKFMCQKQSLKPGIKQESVSLVTTGRGNCKIWSFYTDESPGALAKVKQQQQWIITGRNVVFNKKFATKQFVDVNFWRSYILLLTSDGLLCLVLRNQKEQKLQKCIDLMITKTTSMELYQNNIICGGDSALIKVIDLQTLEMIKKFPKPPPINKQNIEKDTSEEQIIYEQNEQFPQCVCIKTIGTNIYSQFIITIYSNLTIFIWRPEYKEMIAIRSIITHSSSINSVTILEQFENDLIFFSTISSDMTLRVWHLYKKCIFNRQSIDIAKLIGISRNAYCRNLTRIIYMQSEKQVTCISGFRKKSIACIAQKQFIMYSLANFQVVCHQVLDYDAIALEITDQLLYIAQSNAKIIVYEIIEDEDKLHKLREIEFKNKIKYMKIINLNSPEKEKGSQAFILIMTIDTNQVIIYSLKRSKIIYVEKSVTCCSYVGHNVVMCRKDKVIAVYNLFTNKCMDFLSLKHQITEQDECVKNICCNMLWIVLFTSSNKLIVANFSPTIVCTEQFNQNINDLALSDSGEIILVGDFGDILIYRMESNQGYMGMEQEIKKWMEVNDMSWLDGSVWARKKSQRQLAGSVIDSIRLRSSVNNPKSSIRLELPDVQIKYKTQTNDQSIFNPSDILNKMKQIYKNVQEIQKQKKNSSNVEEVQKQPKLSVESPKNANKKIPEDDGLQEIKISRNKANAGQVKRDSKKRIFASTSNYRQSNQTKNQNSSETIEKRKQEDQIMLQFRNNLVDSIVQNSSSQEPRTKKIQQNEKITKKDREQNKFFNQFRQENKLVHSQKCNVREAGEISQVYAEEFSKNDGQRKNSQKQILKMLEQKLSDREFKEQNKQQLWRIYKKLNQQYNNQLVNKADVINKFKLFSKQFMESLTDQSHPI